MNLIKTKNEIIKNIQKKVNDANAKGVVVGISGGIDSSLVVLLCKLAFPKDYLAISMPCESSPLDYACTNELVYKFSLNFIHMDLNKEYKLLKNNLKEKLNSNKELSLITKGNLKARLRMSTLYAIANEKNYLVVGTSNLCESVLGYFTKFGDGAADLFPIKHLKKSLIYKLAKLCDIPEIIIERPPTASLYLNQTDEKEMGVSYSDIEKYIDNKLTNPKKIKLIEKIIVKNRHKL